MRKVILKVLLFIWHIPRNLAIFFITIWQKNLSPDHGPLKDFFFGGGACRFTPTCSEYGKECFEKFGFLKGFIKTTWRVMRCNPWSEGGYDYITTEEVVKKNNTLNKIQKALTLILNFLFPPSCVSCDKEGFVVCDSCFNKIKFNDSQCCPVCRKKSQIYTCQTCENKTNLAGLLVSASYSKNRVMEKLIENFKYRFSKQISEELGDILLKTIKKNLLNKNKRGLKSENLIISYVPLHKNRYRWREFNQAEVLAEFVAKKLDLPTENLLTRTRNTLSQAKLNKKERMKNVKDAFEVIRQGKGESVLLIDDVASTLSTLENCAKELKKEGFGLVFGAVLARGG